MVEGKQAAAHKLLDRTTENDITRQTIKEDIMIGFIIAAILIIAAIIFFIKAAFAIGVVLVIGAIVAALFGPLSKTRRSV